MIIKRIVLKNIRSYVYEEVKFPDGIILLSGDIGSGKSTILLALEFSLFGLSRGTLDGKSLLRNGAESGFVETHLEINGQPIVIHRELKLNKSSVSQTSGYITIGDSKKELTSTELKQQVLTLLHYPQELLTKKALIFRYTVYTPQEEMKQILQCNNDERLEILRKIFGIDKYKRILNNTKIILDHLRSEKRFYEGYISDLDEKKELLKDKKISLTKYNDQILVIRSELEQIMKLKESLESKFEEIKKKKDLLEQLNKDLSLNQYKLDQSFTRTKLLRSKLQALEEELSGQGLDAPNLNQIESSLEKTNQEKLVLEKERQEVLAMISRYQTLITQSKNQRDQITKLNLCPICKQEVTEDHKLKIHKEESKKISGYTKELEENKDKILKLDQRLKDLARKITELLDKRENAKIILEKINLVRSKTKQKEELDLELKELKKEIGETNLEINKIYEKIKILGSLSEDSKKIELELKETNKKILDKELEKKALETKISELGIQVKDLTELISKKEKSKDKLEKISSLSHWFTTEFTNLITNLEKSILLKVHSSFSSYLEKWFSMLVEDDKFNVRLDENFSVKIEQNGYDLNYDYLSGGEKTAAALAYRLALNQVINSILSAINTKDLIILDEPTDGFSAKQLEKIKTILEDLNAKQIILVSHEQEIESLAEHVLRFTKKEHISTIENI